MSGHLGANDAPGAARSDGAFQPRRRPGSRAEPLVEEELFVMIPSHSKLVAPRRTKLSIAEAAELPLILPPAFMACGAALPPSSSGATCQSG